MWISLGKAPDIGAGLGRWLKDLGLDPMSVAQVTDIADRTQLLAQVLANRKCLLVIDDVWKVAHAKPFLSALGNRCGALLTSLREDDLPPEVGHGRVHQVDPLADDDALALLQNRAAAAPTWNSPERPMQRAGIPCWLPIYALLAIYHSASSC